MFPGPRIAAGVRGADAPASVDRPAPGSVVPVTFCDPRHGPTPGPAPQGRNVAAPAPRLAPARPAGHVLRPRAATGQTSSTRPSCTAISSSARPTTDEANCSTAPNAIRSPTRMGAPAICVPTPCSSLRLRDPDPAVQRCRIDTVDRGPVRAERLRSGIDGHPAGAGNAHHGREHRQAPRRPSRRCLRRPGRHP